ncbi:hypothetical protein G7046_g6788 [Stylonectria norvegica]|nr:hypothetical protein G7046_g6788 [Stylonectria norvegica]
MHMSGDQGPRKPPDGSDDSGRAETVVSECLLVAPTSEDGSHHQCFEVVKLGGLEGIESDSKGIIGAHDALCHCRAAAAAAADATSQLPCCPPDATPNASDNSGRICLAQAPGAVGQRALALGLAIIP